MRILQRVNMHNVGCGQNPKRNHNSYAYLTVVQAADSHIRILHILIRSKNTWWCLSSPVLLATTVLPSLFSRSNHLRSIMLLLVFLSQSSLS